MTWTEAAIFISAALFCTTILVMTFGAWALGVAQILGWLAALIAEAAV